MPSDNLEMKFQFVPDDLVSDFLKRLQSEQDKILGKTEEHGEKVGKMGELYDENLQKTKEMGTIWDKMDGVLGGTLSKIAQFAGQLGLVLSTASQIAGQLTVVWNFFKVGAHQVDEARLAMEFFGDSVENLTRAVHGLMSAGDVARAYLPFKELGADIDEYKMLLETAMAISNKYIISVQDALAMLQFALGGSTRALRMHTGIYVDYTGVIAEYAKQHKIAVNAIDEETVAKLRLSTLLEKTKKLRQEEADVISETNKMLRVEKKVSQFWEDVKETAYETAVVVTDSFSSFVDSLDGEMDDVSARYNWHMDILSQHQYHMDQWSKKWEEAREKEKEAALEATQVLREGIRDVEEDVKSVTQVTLAFGGAMEDVRKKVVQRIKDVEESLKIERSSVEEIEELVIRLYAYSDKLREIDKLMKSHKQMAGMLVEETVETAKESKIRKKGIGKPSPYTKKGGMPKEWGVAKGEAALTLEESLAVGLQASEILARESGKYAADAWAQGFLAEISSTAIIDTMGIAMQNYYESIIAPASEMGIILDPLFSELNELIKANAEMWSAWGADSSDALKKTSGFLGAVAKYHKIFALAMVPFEIAEAWRAFATFQFVQGAQHLLAAAWYSKVGGQALASLGGATRTGEAKAKGAEVLERPRESERIQNVFHMVFTAPVFGDIRDGAVAIGRAQMKELERGTLRG